MALLSFFFFLTVSKARGVMSCFKKKRENTKASNAVIPNQNDENEHEKKSDREAFRVQGTTLLRFGPRLAANIQLQRKRKEKEESTE